MGRVIKKSHRCCGNCKHRMSVSTLLGADCKKLGIEVYYGNTCTDHEFTDENQEVDGCERNKF